MKRRDFLWLLGVISGSTVMSACGSPNRSAKFTSYLLPPEEGIVPGEASYHPSTCTECPAGCGVMARVREGRPVKLEFRGEHGATEYADILAARYTEMDEGHVLLLYVRLN